MKARNMLGMALLAVAFTLAARPALAGFEIGYFHDFEKSLDKWSPGSALDGCVTKNTLKLAFERGPFYPDTKVQVPGKFNGYAQLTNTCGYPIWMLINLTGAGKNLRVEFDARGMESCEACIPLAYAGKRVPKYPGQFSTDYTSIGKSWEHHVIKVSIKPEVDIPQQAGTIIAIGFTNLDNLDNLASFGVQRVGLDNVSVTLDSGIPPTDN
jgi:hypothetical protein